jgi:cytochrome c-type biogenesis protein CcmH/NrfF
MRNVSVRFYCIIFGLLLFPTFALGNGVDPPRDSGSQISPKWITVKPIRISNFTQQNHAMLQGHTPAQVTATSQPSQTVSPHPKGPSQLQSGTTSAQSDDPHKTSKSTIEREKALSMRLNRSQQQRFQALADKIIAPCCWTQPISVHASQISDAIKIDIMEKLLEGFSDQQIISSYLQRFGQRILSIPDKGFIFLIPMLASLIAVILVTVLILSWYRRHAKQAHAPKESDMPA